MDSTATGTITGRVLDSSSGNYLEGAEVAISGTARSAGEAYTLYNSIRTEPELGLLNWSMVQPNLSDNGTASFEITGKASILHHLLYNDESSDTQHHHSLKSNEFHCATVPGWQ